MTKSIFYNLLLCVFITSFSFSQKKTLNAIAVDNITIDGKLDEEIWDLAPVATDFVMYSPDNGKPITDAEKTEVRVVYNNDAVFIAAKMYTSQPSKLYKEITLRDNFGSTDNFGVFINGFNDNQQDFRFYITAAGVQLDAVYTVQTDQDFTWDAIWDSEVKITDFGWVVEMKIPYAALRFSSDKKQTWGINFFREVRKTRQFFTWNLIDLKINNDCAQSGILTGIDDIETPTRLFLIPYSSFYLNSGEGKKSRGEFKGGLDIKYGITDAFTLDAILVPDFGQTKFDNVLLNLGPFEQQFSENRPFFTEGTDLFKKGNLLYSRRIGDINNLSVTTSANETVVNSPNSIKLINALKVSGRTKSGLGIGILNAVTEKTSVLIKDSNTNLERRATLQPLANYNVLVLDQRFRGNSSVSFVNTNVTRDGSFRDANVSAVVFDLNTKKNTYNLLGDIKYSYVKDGIVKDGIATSLNFSETSGKYRYGFGGDLYTKDFDNNDLGINFETNYFTLYGNATYRILNPTKTFNSFRLALNLFNQFQKETGKVQGNNININVNSDTKKNAYLGFGISGRAVKTYDYYEALSSDNSKYIVLPEFFRGWYYYSSNFNKKFALDLGSDYSIVNEKKRVNYGVEVSPRYRFSDKFSLIYNFRFNRKNNNIGSVQDFSDLSVFARRDVIEYSNTLEGKYSINNKTNFNLSIRHYWSYVNNNDYLTLQNNGSVTPNHTYAINQDQNLNIWNVDFSYSWWFAPGSQVSILYRNNNKNVFSSGTNFSREFGSNLTKAINNDDLNHIFSISVRYFIDYNSLKH